MALSEPHIKFGIHSVTAYNVKTREYLGMAEVVAEGSISSEGETIPLNGGSSKYPFAVERGLITAEVSLNFGEYSNFLFETLLGKAITINAAEPLGSATALTNAKGTSVFDAVEGILSVGVKAGSETDLKLTGFVVKAVSATTVDVFASTNLDFGQGTPKVFENDLLKITATPLSIVKDSVVEIPGFGLELTGGSANVILMTVDDTAIFESKPINTGSREIIVGSSTEQFNDFGLILAAQRRGNGEMFLIDCFNVVGAGLPIPLTTNEFSAAEVTLMLQRSKARDGIYSYTNVLSANC